MADITLDLLTSFQNIKSSITNFNPADDIENGMLTIDQELSDYITNTLTPAQDDFNQNFPDAKRHLEQYIATIMSDLQTELYGIATGDLVFVNFVLNFFPDSGNHLDQVISNLSCDSDFVNSISNFQSLSTNVQSYFDWIIQNAQNMLTKITTTSDELISKTLVFSQKVIVFQKISALNKLPGMNASDIPGLVELANVDSQLGNIMSNVMDGSYDSTDQVVDEFKQEMITYKTSFKNWVLDFISNYKSNLQTQLNQLSLPACTNISTEFSSLYTDLQTLYDNQVEFFNDLEIS